MRGKKIIFVAIFMAFLTLSSFKTGQAGSIRDLKNKKNELSTKRDKEKEKIKNYEKAKDELETQIKKLDKTIEELSDELEELSARILIVQNNIADKNKHIKENKDKKENLYEELKEKIEFIYENSKNENLQGFLTAESMSDILNKQEYVKEIYGFDNDKLNHLKSLIKELRAARKELKKERDRLEELKKDQEKQQDDLLELLNKKQKDIDSFEDKIKESSLKEKAYLLDIQEQDRIIEQAEKEAALKRQRELERKKKEEELKKQKEQKKQKIEIIETDNRKNDRDRGKSGKGFVWPCPNYSRISSEYGYRKHPTLKVRKMHNGIDMAASVGTGIVAAMAGEVLEAGYNSTMGYYVIIDHGNNLLTIYMHCAKLKTKKGASVSAGQSIATVGSTGRSTGAHLHFGIKVNGKYVNPRKYLK